MVAVALFVFLMAPAAYAADPVGTAQSIKTVGFEGPSDTLATDAILIAGQQDALLDLGPDHRLQAHAAATDCGVAGELYPSGTVSTKFPTTRSGTRRPPRNWEYSRGTAKMALPELADYYESSFDFYYIQPSLAYADQHSFVVRWNDDADPDTFQLAELPYPLDEHVDADERL